MHLIPATVTVLSLTAAPAGAAPCAAASVPAVTIQILSASAAGFHGANLDVSYTCRPRSTDTLGAEVVRPGSPRGSGALATMQRMTCDGRARTTTLHASGPPSASGLPQHGETAACFVDAYKADDAIAEARRTLELS